MSRICELCGKAPIKGYTIARRGLAKKKGGVGRKITGRTRRKYYPNLQKVRSVVNGKTVRLIVCTTCIKSGKIVKPAMKTQAAQ